MMANVSPACAEGYSFPTNLDLDQPIDGLAPMTQAEILGQAVAQAWSQQRLETELGAWSARRVSRAGRRHAPRDGSSAALRFHLVDDVGSGAPGLDRDGTSRAPGPVGGLGQVERGQGVVGGDLGRQAVPDAPGERFEFFGIGPRVALLEVAGEPVRRP